MASPRPADRGRLARRARRRAPRLGRRRPAPRHRPRRGVGARALLAAYPAGPRVHRRWLALTVWSSSRPASTTARRRSSWSTSSRSSRSGATRADGRSGWRAVLVVIGIVIFVSPTATGVRRRRRRVRHLLRRRPVGHGPGPAAPQRPRDRQRRLKVEQEEATRRAIAEERATIARELHDVVAHAISVTVLQARGARRMLGRDERAVRRSLDAIEHTNTQALGDMRRLLALLRDTEGDARRSRSPPWRGSTTWWPTSASPGCQSSRGDVGRGPGRPPGRRPVGLPDHPGGPHQRAQARRPGERDGAAGLRRRRADARGAGRRRRLDHVERERSRAGRHPRAGRRRRRRDRGRARPRTAASWCAPGCPTRWRPEP